MGDQTPGRVGARRLVGAAGLGVLVSGLIVNVYLAVVARALPPAEYATFGSFWALALVVGFGAFLPLEQELARRLPLPGDRQALLRAASGAAAVLAGIALVVLVGALPIIWRSLDGDVSVLLALGALCVVSAGQFLVRGTLIGTDRLVRHAAVMVLDAVLRLAFAVGVFIVGGADAAAFCWALVAAIVLAHLPQLPAAWRRAVAWERPFSPGAPADRPSVRGLTRAAMPLLVGSVCAQLLLNGLPVLVVARGRRGQRGRGRACSSPRSPWPRRRLSMVVPLQSAVVPTLTRLIAADRRREVVVLLVKGVALLAAVAAIGVPLACFVGPCGGLARLRRRLHDRRPGPRDHPLRGARPHRARRRHPGPRRPGSPPRRRAELDGGPPGRRRHVLAGPGRDPLRRGRVRGRQRGGRGGQLP